MLKAKLALLAAKNWKKIVPIALGILFFPFLIIVLMVSMTSTVTIEDDKAALYMDISEEIGNKYDVYIDYTQLVGIDAVRYAQDFSQATDATIKELAEKFVKVKYTIIIVTHNMQQAVRISDNTAFFLLGELVEFGETEKLFSAPRDKRTEDYITGRFG